MSHEGWEDEAPCREVDPDLFFPTDGREHVSDVKRMCQSCPVRALCLGKALGNNERFGIWGGYSTRERDALKSAARRTA